MRMKWGSYLEKLWDKREDKYMKELREIEREWRTAWCKEGVRVFQKVELTVPKLEGSCANF